MDIGRNLDDDDEFENNSIKMWWETWLYWSSWINNGRKWPAA